MSRVLFLKLDERQVVKKCAAANVGISAIERLPNGGVRLVCMSSDGAAQMARELKSHLLDQATGRDPHRPHTPLW